MVAKQSEIEGVGAQSSTARRAYEGPALWTSAELKERSDWIIDLQPAHIAELRGALAKVKAKGLERLEIDRDAFPLDSLARTMSEVSRQLEQGPGVVSMRGMPVGEFAQTDLELIYWGMGRHLGNPVSQNKHGDLLGFVRDQGVSLQNPTMRGYQTRAHLTLHTDSSDVVALLCINPAQSGGESKFTSSMSVHNTILTERPDLLEVLYQPFYLDRKGEQRPGVRPFYQLAVFHDFMGHLTCRYNRGFMRTAARHEEVPELSPLQLEALDFLDEVAHRPSLCVRQFLRPGEIQWLNNYVMLHGREDYEDFEDPARKRLMLRLWLSSPNARSLPPVFKEMYGDLKPGQRTGVPQQSVA